MTEQFFERPILNSPYAFPDRHWELDADGQPTNRIIETRRRSDLITPVPKPKKRHRARGQTQMMFEDEAGLSSEEQEYNPTPIINEIRTYVETWRNLPNSDQWLVTPETARLLKHWRHHQFEGIRPFFCQIEAVETAIWLTEVAPKVGPRVAKFWAHIKGANEQANPELLRLALKLATGAGKTTVSAGAKGYDPLALPTVLLSALEALYGHYQKTFELWENAGIAEFTAVYEIEAEFNKLIDGLCASGATSAAA